MKLSLGLIYWLRFSMCWAQVLASGLSFNTSITFLKIIRLCLLYLCTTWSVKLKVSVLKNNFNINEPSLEKLWMVTENFTPCERMDGRIAQSWDCTSCRLDLGLGNQRERYDSGYKKVIPACYKCYRIQWPEGGRSAGRNSSCTVCQQLFKVSSKWNGGVFDQKGLQGKSLSNRRQSRTTMPAFSFWIRIEVTSQSTLHCKISFDHLPNNWRK